MYTLKEEALGQAGAKELGRVTWVMNGWDRLDEWVEDQAGGCLLDGVDWRM
jgi:hypothetical protein